MVVSPQIPLDLKGYVLDLLRNRFLRLTPAALVKKIRRTHPMMGRFEIKSVIKELISEGILSYSQQYSTTYLMLAPTGGLMSSRVILQPRRYGIPVATDGIALNLNDGVSFGAGDHPTTRLCLEGLDVAVRRLKEVSSPIWAVRALDVGTGSGVLAIAAALMGAQKVLALDIDPVACHEAKANVELNQVTGKICLAAGGIECLGSGHFHLVLANLRMPTLVKLWPTIIAKIPVGGLAILSGFRPNEKTGIETAHQLVSWKELWYSRNRGWAAMVLERSDSRFVETTNATAPSRKNDRLLEIE